MKKIFAILMTICLLAGALSIAAFAAEKTLPAPAKDILLRVTAIKGDDTTVLVGDFKSFEDGWNKAMEIAGDDDEMEDKGYARIVVDIYTDWKAGKDGNFTNDSWWESNGDGFDNDTIYIPEDAKVTLNLNGHTINRGLTKDINDGEVIFINDDADVIINNGTITGGYSNSEGGCLYIEGGANVTLNNVHIIGNKVYNDDGAGVYMYGGSKLTVNGGSFENNTADGYGGSMHMGGAVYIKDSTAKFNNVVFKSNRCKLDGAAIYAYEAEVSIENCTFDGHETDRDIFNVEYSSFDVSGSTFINNKGYDLFDLNYSSLIINSSEFKSNDLYNIINTSYNNTVGVANSNFTGNDACMIDAASYGLNKGSYYRDCAFIENTHKDRYSELYGDPCGSFVGNFANMVFYDCEFGNSNFKRANNLIIRYTDLSAEEAVLGATVIFEDGTEETIGYKFFDFGWNEAMQYALMDRVDSVTLDFHADWNAENGEFGSLKNGFRDDTIYIPEEVKLTLNLNGHTINRGLKEDQGDGHVILIASDAEVTINNGTITGGYSNDEGGGLYIKGGANVTLNDVNVTGNTLKGDDGAGIYMYGGATLTMNGGSISSNILQRGASLADEYGAGIYAEDSTVTLTGVTLKNNGCGGPKAGMIYGSAVYSTYSTVTLKDCTVESNGVTTDNAIYFCNSTIYANESTLVIENTSFTGNGAKHGWQAAEYKPYKGSSVISLQDTNLTMTGGKVTNNNQVFLFSIWDSVADVDGVDFTGNSSLVMNVRDASSAQSTFANCKFSAGSSHEEFKHDFQFKGEKAGINFVDCDFGKATFSNKNAATFVGGTVSNSTGSIFGEGSLSTIIALLALIASGVSICMTVAQSKKKTAPAAAEDEE